MIDPNDSPTTSDSTVNKATDSKKSATSSAASGFLSHLIEMRDRLLRAVIVVAVAFIALFPFAKHIYNWLAAPLVDQGQEMIIIGPVAPFLIPMKLTLLVAFLIALPYLLYQLWSFVAPGLYKHEKRLVYPLLASSVFLFYLGIAFVYYVLLPMMFKIIPQFAPDIATFSPDIAQYLDFTMMMFMAFGIGFEMPIATILLISTGMTTAEKLKHKRPYVIVGAFVVGMLLTPPDVVSQIMLAIPMWLLFELGLIFSKFFNIRVKEASEAKEARDNSDPSTGAAAITADKLWEDDKYTYEKDEGASDSDISDEERSILNKDPIDDKSYEDYLNDESTDDPELDDDGYPIMKEDDKPADYFFDDDGFHEMSDEEMETELDRIEADEVADDIVEKKAKKRAKAKKKSKSKDPKKKK